MTKENTTNNENQLDFKDQIIEDSHKKTEDYLLNIEKIFGKYLKDEDKGNYDGSKETDSSKGEQTEIERYISEDFSDLKSKLEKHKKNLTKQSLITTLLHETLKERGIEYNKISKKIDIEKRGELFSELNKEQVNFTKEIGNIGEELDKAYSNRSVEVTYSLAEVELANKSYALALELGHETDKDLLDNADKSMRIMEKYSKGEVKEKLERELLKSIQNKNKEALNEVLKLKLKNKEKPGSVSEEELNKAQRIYEDTVLENTNIAIKHELIEENNEIISKTIERGMTSGLLPISLMLSDRLKKGLPILPAVIGLGIWTRLSHIVTTDKLSIWQKTGEVTNIVSYTVASIAPVSGTIIAGYETNEAWKRYKEGKGSFGDVVANGAGTVVSAVFDGITIFLIATGVGAAPAVGVQATRAGAKEATKIGIKKVFGYFIEKEGRQMIRTNTTNSFKALIGGKTIFNKETEKYVTSFSLNTFKKVWTEIGKDTLSSIKQIFTLKQTRDVINKGIFMVPKLGDKYARLRPGKFIELKTATTKGEYLEHGIIARTSIERKVDNNIKELTTSDELQYIDSLKNDLSVGGTEKLIKELEGLKDVFGEKSLKKLKKMKLKLENDKKNNVAPEKYKRLEKEIKKYETDKKLIKIKLDKILNIINLRTKNIELTGKQKDIEDNNILIQKSHEITKELFGIENIPNDIKLMLLKDIWGKSTKKFEYHKSKDFKKFVFEIIKGDNIEQQIQLISELKIKFSQKQLKELLKNLKDGENNNLNNLNKIAINTIKNILKNNNFDIYNINKLYKELPSIENNSISKEITNKILDIYGKNKLDTINESIKINLMQSLSFLNKRGNITEIINKNTILQKNISKLIDSHEGDNYHFRGLYNLHIYLKGSNLESKTTKILKLKLNIKDDEVFKDFDRNFIKNSIEKEINNIKNNPNGEKIINFIERTLKQLGENNQKTNLDLVYYSEDLINLIASNKDLLKNANNFNQLKKFLISKIGKIQNEGKTQELIILAKILGETGYKIEYKDLIKFDNFSQTLLIKNNISNITDKTGGIKKSGKDKLVSDILIEKLENICDNGIDLTNENNVYDILYTFDLLGAKYKEGELGKSYKTKFEKLTTDNGEKLEKIIEKILLSKEGFIGNYNKLTNILGFEIKVKLGEGIFLIDKSGTGNKYNLRISDIINLKGELIDTAISNSTFIKSKYKENIGYIAKISYLTGFHNIIKSSDNPIFNKVLDLSKEYEKIKDLGEDQIKQLMSEYKIDSLGDRFESKVILSNLFLIKNNKTNIIKESLLNDINNGEIPIENKMSLIYNIQDSEVQILLFKELINKENISNLSKKGLQHDLFKKLSSKIDNLEINNSIIDTITDENFVNKLILGEGINELTKLVSIIQQNKNIDDNKIIDLINVFKKINFKYNTTPNTQLQRIYDEILLELSRIDKLKTHGGIAKFLSQSIKSESNIGENIKKKLIIGLDTLKKYKDIDSKINLGVEGIKIVEELTKVIQNKILSSGIRSSDLIEGDELKIILGNDIITKLDYINLEIVKIHGGEIYYKVKNLDYVMSSKELLTYQESLAKLTDLIINNRSIVRSSDLLEYFSEAELELLKKNGFNEEKFIDFKTGKSDTYISINDFIQNIVNYYQERTKSLKMILVSIIASIRVDNEYTKEDITKLEQEYILLINQIDNLDSKIILNEKSFNKEINKLIDNSDILKNFFSKYPDEKINFIKKARLEFGGEALAKQVDGNIPKQELEATPTKDIITNNPEYKNIFEKISKIPDNINILGTNISLKKAMIIMITLGLMTPQDAEAAVADWEKIETLEKAGKYKEALQLRKETIAKVTNLYINEFKQKYQDRMEKKLEGLSEDTKAIMLKSYEVGIKYLNGDQKMESKFVMTLYNFFNKYDKETGNSKKYAKYLQKIKGLPKEFTDAFIELGKESDQRSKLSKRLDKEEEKIKQREERIKNTNKLLNILNQL